MVTFGTLSPQEGYAQARVSAERALVLDPWLAEAHASLALVKLYVDWDWAAAEAQFLRALHLSPNYATARHWYAQFLSYRGEHDAAIREAQHALELDPLSLPIRTVVGTVLYYARRYEEAAEQFRRVLEMEPAFYVARLQLGAVYFHQGRLDEALIEAHEAVRQADRHPLPLALLGFLFTASGDHAAAREILRELQDQAIDRHVSPAYPAVIHMGLGDTDRALARLQRVFDARDDWAIIIRAASFALPAAISSINATWFCSAAERRKEPAISRIASCRGSAAFWCTASRSSPASRCASPSLRESRLPFCPASPRPRSSPSKRSSRR
jgi:tetratricopeptide (TPR) repeat protein